MEAAQASRMTFPTKIELAHFLENVLRGTMDKTEWSKFMVAHYEDDILEQTRREFVRIIAIRGEGEVGGISDNDRNLLQVLLERMHK